VRPNRMTPHQRGAYRDEANRCRLVAKCSNPLTAPPPGAGTGITKYLAVFGDLSRHQPLSPA